MKQTPHPKYFVQLTLEPLNSKMLLLILDISAEWTNI